jgi:O-methyltransferase involved in polyketide biosynthesis
MTAVKVTLDQAMGTSLIMLYGLSCDARSEPSLLHDSVAAQAFEQVDYDFGPLRKKMPPKLIGPSIASRARHFDTWTTEFLAQHPEATVVNLGAGLDSRVWRVDPGPGVTWYDVDFPGVVDVRRKIFPSRDGYHLIPASVTDPDLFDGISGDRPTLVIAQGLTMYLEPADGHALFRRVTDHFTAGGVVALDTHNSWALPRQDKLVHRYFGARLHWAIDSPADLERENPALRCTDSVSGMVPLLDTSTPVRYKAFIRLALHVPKIRDAGLYVRYAFGPA